MNSQDFFPLRVANSWTYCGYADTAYKRTYLIKDSVSIADKKYFLYGLKNFDSDTIRKDIDGNIWKLRSGQDILWFDFTRDSGDVYLFPPLGTYRSNVTTCKYLTKKTYVGVFSKCIGLFFDIPQVIDDEIAYTFAPGIGPAEISGAWRYDLLYSATINNVPVHVSDNMQRVSVSFSLSQNYPNPFNPTTLINYQLPSNCIVSVKVFDVMGREIATLVNQRQAPGTYSVSFDASRLPSGIYFYSLQSNQYRDVKKMLLIK